MKTQLLLIPPASAMGFFTVGWWRVIAILLFLTLLPALSFGQIKQWDKTLGGSDLDGLNTLQQTRDGGYILGGWSYSPISGDKTEDPRGGNDYWVVKLDAAGNKEWDKTLGGSDYDELTSLQQTSDGGYILGGWSNSPASGDKTQESRGTYDFWIVKLDSAGTKQWDKTFGGNRSEYMGSLIQTSDKGYLVGGRSNSAISGDKTAESRGNYDYWVVKLDEAGEKQWDKTFGGADGDELTSLQQTRDLGYVLGGQSNSDTSGNKTAASKGFLDFWVVKLDAAGEKQWDKGFGGNSSDFLNSLQQTHDGGYILGGSSVSGISGDKTEASRELMDYWVVKIDSAGSKQWDKTLGGNNYDELAAVQQAKDGSYIVGGYSVSGITGDKTEENKSGCFFFECPGDYWVVKLDSSGSIVWDKTLGGTANDAPAFLQQTSDGGYIVGGTSSSDSNEDKTENSKGYGDFWVVKLSAEVQAPLFLSCSPMQGLPGTLVTITGKNLASTMEVHFNGAEAKFNVLNDSTLKAVVPPASTSGPITLVTSVGSVISETSFTVLQPRLQTFFPRRGGPGTTVLLLGDRLGTVQEVRFNGTPATDFTVYFDFLLVAVVPQEATTGKISLVLEGGGQATHRSTFTVAGATPVVVATQPPPRIKASEAPRLPVVVSAAYPNPFSSQVTIPLQLPAPATVQLSIYTLTGQLLTQITTSQLAAGMQQVQWNGLNQQNQPVTNGLYYYRLLVNGKAYSGKLLKTDAAR